MLTFDTGKFSPQYLCLQIFLKKYIESPFCNFLVPYGNEKS